ncbi:diguanylate cyclase/phosphodiesterase [alpha proteobacterium U9-1i]|nr:diguanylate cyclase/phosphodiesterase [alpha proteobacterium U9-1i]
MTNRPQGRSGALDSSAVKLLALFAAAALVVFLSQEFSRHGGRIASIWPLNAMLLTVMMRQSRLHWPAILATGALANLSVNFIMGDSGLRAIGLTGANLAEVYLCAQLLWRRDGVPDITRARDLLSFGLAAGVAGPAVSALIAAGVLIQSAPFIDTLATWYAADALGMLIFAPALLVFSGPQTDALNQARTPLGVAVTLALIVGVLFMVFAQDSLPILFLVPPVLMFATFRLGTRGAALGILLTAAVAISCAIAGKGPTQLVEGSDLERVLMLQAFLAVMSLSTLPVAAALSDAVRARSEIVAARLRAERSEAKYRALADYSTDIVVRLGPGGIISYASPACRILGVDPEHAIGRSTLDFVAAEDRAFAEKVLADLFSGAEPDRSVRREYRVPRPDGSIMWLEGNPSIIRNADGDPVEVVTIYRDITARRQLEHDLSAARVAAEGAVEAVRESEARYRAMADASLDMIARMSLDGTMLFVSPSAAVVMGYAPEELIGTRTLDYTHPDDVESVKTFFRALAAEGPSASPQPYTFRARRKDGRFIWLEGIPRVLYDEQGQPIEIQDSARDVTERKRLEAALAEARHAAEAANAVKSQFLANMSHELRTPLNSIAGFSHLLMKSPTIEANNRRYAELVARSGHDLLRLVNDLLDFSSLEAGALNLDPQPFDAAKLVERSVEGFRPDADAKGVALEVEIDDGVERRLIGDESRINQVLLNLIGNACKFTDSGAVHVSVRALDRPGTGQTLRFEVRDTGIGIAAGKEQEVFQRFVQADSSIARRFGGSGLGLAISKHLVELMGGEIGVASVEGEGSLFWFTLSLPVADSTHEVAPPNQSTASPVQKRRILIADDAELNRELAVALLSGDGHIIEFAADGVEALSRVQEGGYDIVFMDVQMPRTCGRDATRAIRALDGFADLPIVAMTAQALPEQVADCLAAGMNDYVAKPLAPESLKMMVSKWLAAGRQPAPARVEALPAHVLAELQRRFIERARVDLDVVLARNADADLRSVIHRAAGTAGSLGYGALSAAALALDQKLSEGERPSEEDWALFIQALRETLAA